MYTKESAGIIAKAAVRSRPSRSNGGPVLALTGAQRRALGSARRRLGNSTSGVMLEAIRNIEIGGG